jgi:hypothetical protein
MRALNLVCCLNAEFWNHCYQTSKPEAEAAAAGIKIENLPRGGLCNGY